MKKGLIICLIIINCIFLVGCDKEKEDLFNEISYTIPDMFEKDEAYTSSRDYSYSSDGIYCYISIRAYEKEYYDEDQEEWFKGSIHIDLTDEVTKLDEINVNNNKVLTIDVKKTDSTINHYYGFNSKNYYYLVDYEISNKIDDRNLDEKRNPCYKYKDEIIYSINIKQ